MSEPDNPMPQTTTQECITCGEPIRIPVEWIGEGPIKHDDCPQPTAPLNAPEYHDRT